MCEAPQSLQLKFNLSYRCFLVMHAVFLDKHWWIEDLPWRGGGRPDIWFFNFSLHEKMHEIEKTFGRHRLRNPFWVDAPHPSDTRSATGQFGPRLRNPWSTIFGIVHCGITAMPAVVKGFTSQKRYYGELAHLQRRPFTGNVLCHGTVNCTAENETQTLRTQTQHWSSIGRGGGDPRWGMEPGYEIIKLSLKLHEIEKNLANERECLYPPFVPVSHWLGWSQQLLSFTCWDSCIFIE